MPRLWALVTCMLLFLSALAADAADKKQARVDRIGDWSSRQIRVRPSLITADTCTVRHDSGAVWKIDGWVIGNELYKEYLDPGAACTGPYPFTVLEIGIQMYFVGTPQMSISVDIEDIDNATPGCPAPGNLLSISSEYTVDIPGEGLYEIWVPLDTPYTVNGPFFAGFFIGNTLNPADSPAVVVDSFPVLCTSYNIWDDGIGFVDLNNNQFYNFPGRLLLYASGIVGGGGGLQPAPALKLVAPEDSDTLFATADLWAWETAGSDIIEYVSFEFSSGGGYFEIGRDYDGTRPLRDGVTSGTGNGFALKWDFAALAEGTYKVRATAVDTLGRSSSDSVTVYLEPTPPVPNIVSPENGADFCSPLELLMTTSDENLSLVQVFRKDGQTVYSAGMVTVDQSTLGDANGIPDDGNLAANGEFGDYYCGPVAAAIAVKLWFDRGYTQLMKEGFDFISVDTLVERLADRFDTRQNLGTYDENLLSELGAYLASKLGQVAVDYQRTPDYFRLRTWVEEEERAVIIGLRGTPAVWLAVDGFSQWQQPDGSYLVRVSDPLTGSMITMPMRTDVNTHEVYYQATWHQVDIMVSLLAKDWSVSRALIGADLNGADGWSLSWTPSGLTEDNLYFFRASGLDVSGLHGSEIFLLRYNCSQAYVAGDYDNDGQVGLPDLNYLISFIALGGPAPVGGAGRADANCDNSVNIADVVYYMNYLFGNAATPCY